MRTFDYKFINLYVNPYSVSVSQIPAIFNKNVLVSNWSVRGRSNKHDKLVKKLLDDASVKELEF